MKGKEMSSAMMGRGLGHNVMERNMLGQDIYSNAMDNNELMTSNVMMGRDMYQIQDMYLNDMDNNKMMTSNIMIGRDMHQMTPVTRMNQKMQIQTMPSQSLNNFF